MARYATIDWDVNDSPSESQWTVDAQSVAWAEYAGGASPQTDGALDVTTGGTNAYGLTLTRRYLSSGAFEALDPNGIVTDTRYSHGDLTGSAQVQTDDAGASIDLTGSGGYVASYTAFGEPVGPAGVGDGSTHAGLGTRYQYDGDWGYESNTGDGSAPLLGLPGAHAWGASGQGYSGANPNLAPIAMQHLGWRWYQPDNGRFVQRDPIGLRGGRNVYVYLLAAPLSRVDPKGLDGCLLCSGSLWCADDCPTKTKGLTGGIPPLVPPREYPTTERREEMAATIGTMVILGVGALGGPITGGIATVVCVAAWMHHFHEMDSDDLWGPVDYPPQPRRPTGPKPDDQPFLGPWIEPDGSVSWG